MLTAAVAPTVLLLFSRRPLQFECRLRGVSRAPLGTRAPHTSLPPTRPSPQPGIRQLVLHKCVRWALARWSNAALRRTDAGNRSLMGISFTVLWAICWSALMMVDCTHEAPQYRPLCWERPSKTPRPSFSFQIVLEGLKGGRLMSSQRAAAPPPQMALLVPKRHTFCVSKATQSEEVRSRPPTALALTFDLAALLCWQYD